MWGHLKRDDEKFEFTKENRLIEILYSNNRENRVKWNTLAFHVLPLLSITEFLFSNVGFVKEVVECTMPYLNKDGVLEKLKWLVYAMEGIYDNKGALKKIRELTIFMMKGTH
ncbi:hypothetical protein AHAS_Ahas08G0106800 [Arachis hypogaea]